MEYNVFQNNTILESAKHNDWAKLYNLLDIFCDDTKNALKIKKEEYLENGKYPIVDQGQSFIAGYTNNDDYLYTDTPSIIFGDHTKVLKYIDFPLFIGADGVKLLKLKINDDNINVKFVYYFLKTVELPSDGYSRHFKYLKQVIVPIPKRIIQDKIVDILDKAQELIDKRKEQTEALDELVKSKFIEMFGDPISNSKGLNTKNFEEVVRLQRGFDLPTYERDETGNYNVWGSNGILSKHNCYKVNEPGIVTGRSGSLGKVYYTYEPYWPLNTTLFSKNTFGNNVIYLAYLLRFYRLERFSNGTGVPTLNRNLLDGEKIINVSLEEQNKFADFVKQVDKLKSEMEKSLKELEDNFNSLMQRAFKGELF